MDVQDFYCNDLETIGLVALRALETCAGRICLAGDHDFHGSILMISIHSLM